MIMTRPFSSRTATGAARAVFMGAIGVHAPCIHVVNFGVCEVGRTVDTPVISAGHQDTAVQQLDGREKCACLISWDSPEST